MTPYTYLIGWSALDTWYYGVRYAKGCDTADLWVKYFTSSNFVKKFREEHGEPDVVEVRRCHSDAASARRWEDRVLRRIKAVRSPRWLNLQTSGSDFNPTSVETRAKLSAAFTGRVLSAEHRAKISAAKQGRALSDDTRAKMSASHQGRALSDDTRAKMSASRLGYVMPEETRAKLIGRVVSEETRAKMRAARAGKKFKETKVLA